MSTYNPPPGTEDILPDDITVWHFIEEKSAEVFKLYGYGEIRTPIFEYTELFTRGIGEQTEVVQKEMYTFEDRGGRSLTLRPEGTAGVMRAIVPLVQQGLSPRVYYCGPMFRGERPAAGRKRQFHQIGSEFISNPSPGADAETICLLMFLLKELGIERTGLKINTRGESTERQFAQNLLREMLVSKRDGLCPDCQRRWEKNVWRILDCKVQSCRKILSELDGLDKLFSDKTSEYLDEVIEILKAEGIKAEKDPLLVRGLDYYAHTVFEVLHDGVGAQNALAGGGRYEIVIPGLKNPLCGVGFACGVERLIMAAASEGNKKICATREKPLYIISLSQSARKMNFRLAQDLRKNGTVVILDFEDRSMKSAMRAADKSGAKFVIIRGDDEIAKKSIMLKNMLDGTQTLISEDHSVEEILRITKSQI